MTIMVKILFFLTFAVLVDVCLCNVDQDNFEPNVTVRQCSGNNLIVHLEQTTEGGYIHITGQGPECGHKTTEESRDYIFDMNTCKIISNKMFRVIIQKSYTDSGPDMILHVICVVDFTKRNASHERTVKTEKETAQGDRQYKTDLPEPGSSKPEGPVGNTGKSSWNFKNSDVTASQLHVGDNLSNWFNIAMNINTNQPERAHDSTIDNSTVETNVVPMTTTILYDEATMTPVTNMGTKINDVISAGTTELPTMSAASNYVISPTEVKYESETTTSPEKLNKDGIMSTSMTFPEQLAQEPMKSTTPTPVDNITQKSIISKTVTSTRSKTVAESETTVPREFDNQKQSTKEVKHNDNEQWSRHQERTRTIKRLYQLLRQYNQRLNDKPPMISQNKDSTAINKILKLVNLGHSRGRDTFTTSSNRNHRIGGPADTSRLIREHQQQPGHKQLRLNKLHHHLQDFHHGQINRHENVLGQKREHEEWKKGIDNHSRNNHHETTHAQGVRLFNNRRRSQPSNFISKRSGLLKKLAHWFHMH